MKDNFSAQAIILREVPAEYPPELFEYVTGFVKIKILHGIVAQVTGKQLSELGRYFEKIYATDISRKQIEHAEQRRNIIYQVEPAEQTSWPQDR